jgi:hypothetical protein
VRLWSEVRDAAHLVASEGDGAPEQGAALAWLPALAAVPGALAATLALGLGHWSSLLGGAAGLAALRVVSGARGGRLGLGLLVLEALALVPATSAGQAVALALAPPLGAWSRVVQCHGGRAVLGSAPSLVGRASFREFGVASVVAIGGALVALEAVGLVAVIAAVVTTLVLRVVLHRRRGGMPPAGPTLSHRVVETVVLVVMAAPTV